MAKKAKDDFQFVQALTTVTDIGEGELFRAGVPVGGLGTGKIDITPDGSVTNITTNGNLEAPICDGYASAPAKLVPGGVPGIFWTLWDESNGAKVLKVNPMRGLKGVEQKNIKYDGRLPVVHMDYTEIGAIDISLTAYSPLILGDTSENYRDSTIPGAVFTFKLKNNSDKKQKYRFAYSWQNMVGVTGYYNEKGWGVADNRNNDARFQDDEKYPGVYFFTHAPEQKDPRARGTYSLRVKKAKGQTIESRTWKDIGEFWSQFSSNSPLIVEASWHHGSDAVLAVSGELKKGESCEIQYAVSWYFPYLVEETDHKASYGRMYQNYFADSWDVSAYLLENNDTLYEKTTAWQNQIFNSNLPDWFKYKMCDDLFPMVTNAWYTKKGQFSVSEAATNMGAMMGTIDQRNASQAPYLLSFPKICRSELDMFREKQSVPGKDEFGQHWDFEKGTPDLNLNHIGAVPHDIGHEDLRRYAICPSYEWQAGHWPDLQSGYILQWYAYYCWTNDPIIRKKVYESVKLTEGFLRRLDMNGDCIPDLWGWGSSSYDNWSFPYYGIQPYVATMYMAALAAMEKMAKQMGENDYRNELNARRKTASENLIKANWNGSYFKCWTHAEHKKWDGGIREHGAESDSIHVSQLAGQWYASMMGLGYLVESDMVETALQTVADNNHSIVTGVAPIEVWPGKDGVADTWGESWPHYTEAYFVSLAIYESQKDVGMEQLYKLWKVLIKNNARWDCGLGIAGPQNDGMAGRWYMTNTAGWFCMLALAGLWIDLPGKELMIAPNLPPSMGGVLKAVPVLAQDFWANMSKIEGKNSFINIMEITRFEGKTPMKFNTIKTRYEKNQTVKDVVLEINGIKEKAKYKTDEQNRYIIIEKPITIDKSGNAIKIEVIY